MPGLSSITDKIAFSFLLGVCLSFVSTAVADDLLDARISAEAIHSDNGGLAPSGQEVGDWIARTELQARIDFKRERTDLTSDYRIVSQSFSKDTQKDNTVVEGQSEWYWEPVDERFAMAADHSRYRLIRDNAERFTQENQDERTITSIGPESRFRLTSVDRLELSTQLVDVRFAEGNSQNSERWVNRATWVHALSPISSAFLTFSHQDVDFDSARADYDYYQLSATYARRLRHIEWSLQLGRNRIARDTGSEVNGTSYGFNLDWSAGYHQIQLAALADVTDSSLGNRNQLLVGDVDLGNQLDFDSEFREPDATDRTSLEFMWNTRKWVCEICRTSVFYRRVTEDFVSSDAEREQTFARAAVTIQPSAIRRYTLAYEAYGFERATETQSLDQEENRWHFSAFHKALKDLEVGVKLSWRDRDQGSSNASDSKELRSSVALEYTLF